MRKNLNLTVIGASRDINNAICDLLPKHFNSVFSLQRKHLSKEDNEYGHIIENSEAIILDISTAEKKNTEEITYVNEWDEKIPVIAIGTYTERVFADSIIKKGAAAYLSFNSFADELEDALENILNNKKYICKQINSQSSR
ncbi:MAG: response regulator transcription factor [Flavobacteriales bacterium]|nr:response regulator transcription factor [Flavobacteriales bacterium]